MKGIFFDLDGTLVDTAADFVVILEQMCREAGVAPVPPNAVYRTVSNGARALVELAFGISPENEADRGTFVSHHQRLLDLYENQITQTRALLYPGMDELLGRLEAAGIPWGVVTNKPEKYSVALLKKLNLFERCGVLICPDHVTCRKPHPEALLLACSRTACAAGDCLYVGDHPRDIEAGARAGMRTMAAAYGYLPDGLPIEDWNADVIVHSVTDINLWLEQNSLLLTSA